MGLKVLAGKLKEMREYLEKVVEGKYRYNSQIIYEFQDIFNLLPNLKIQEMVNSFSVKSNDYMYVIYISAMIRSVLSLHDLINNRIAAKDIEVEKAKNIREEEEAKKKAEEEKAKAAEEGDESKKEAEAETKKDWFLYVTFYLITERAYTLIFLTYISKHTFMIFFKAICQTKNSN